MTTETKRVIVYRKKQPGDMTCQWIGYPANSVPLQDGDNFIIENTGKSETPPSVFNLLHGRYLSN